MQLEKNNIIVSGDEVFPLVSTEYRGTGIACQGSI